MPIILINGPLQSAVCDYGVGHQLPLGLLMIGGPLLDAGHELSLIDAARHHLSDAAILAAVRESEAQIVMMAHVGSTSAHPCCTRLLAAIKAEMPEVFTVYGGVYPTYHYKTVLAEHPEVDVIVRGEGEATVLDLVATLASQKASDRFDLSSVAGIAWRDRGEVRMTASRPPIQQLDAFRIGWELITDWDAYQAFGLGRAAVVQFSRGCPHTCTYCGQWMFWKRWRHRGVKAFVDEMEWLYREHDVRFFWLADENPTTIKGTWAAVLAEIGARALPIGMCASIRAQDIVRDADILPLYQQAGFLYVLMGVETVSDATLDKIRKGSTVDDAYQAVRLLRAHGILSIVDYMFGIEEESVQSIVRALRGLLHYDGDFVNALFLTPHAWTPLGRALQDAPRVEEDRWRWDYRQQVVDVPDLSPTQLFLGVKIVETLYHLHPRRLWRILTVSDPRLRRLLRFSLRHTTAVFGYELYDFFRHRRRYLQQAHQKQPRSAQLASR